MKRTAEEGGLVVAEQNLSAFVKCHNGWQGQESSMGVMMMMGEGCDSSSSPQRIAESRRVRARTATSTEPAYEVSEGAAVGHVPLPAQSLMNTEGGLDAMRGGAFLQHASSASKTRLEDMMAAAAAAAAVGPGTDANSVQQQQEMQMQMQQRLPTRSASCPDFLRVFEQQQRAAEMERRREQQMHNGSIH